MKFAAGFLFNIENSKNTLYFRGLVSAIQIAALYLSIFKQE
jgi:hypothetical protein